MQKKSESFVTASVYVQWQLAAAQYMVVCNISFSQEWLNNGNTLIFFQRTLTLRIKAISYICSKLIKWKRLSPADRLRYFIQSEFVIFLFNTDANKGIYRTQRPSWNVHFRVAIWRYDHMWSMHIVKSIYVIFTLPLIWLEA